MPADDWTTVGSQEAGKKAFITFTVDTDGKDGSKTGSVTSTDNHLIWLPDTGMWVEAKQLKPGMWLQAAAGTWVQITAVKRTVKHERVYNLTVDGLHSYYVLADNEPVLVHNVDEEDVCRLTLGAGPFAKEGVATTKRKVTRSDPEYVDNQINGIVNGCHTCGRRTPATKNGEWVSIINPRFLRCPPTSRTMGLDIRNARERNVSVGRQEL
ncbi:polymorphic toxin-type HINT domain-containing protein [Micromonospora sp. NPDC023644]|uniref:polymorphic toxin-type HINT domain-containing protein n=1 Tax=Micromonospora sp. NPDC023644 TaxID=3154321 RepID=UPI0033EE478E